MATLSILVIKKNLIRNNNIAIKLITNNKLLITLPVLKKLLILTSILIFFATLSKAQNLAFSQNEMLFIEAYEALLTGDHALAENILEKEIFTNKNYDAVPYYYLAYCISADKKTPARKKLLKATRKAVKAHNAWGACHKKKYFKQALDVITQKADNGNAVAQFRLAQAYRSGFGVEEDRDLVVKYLEMAAEQGLACAQYGMGQIYADGIGVDKDLEKAIMYIEKSLKVNNRKSSQNYLEKLKKKKKNQDK